MKKGTAWLFVVLALVIGVGIGIQFPNPREDGIIPHTEITPVGSWSTNEDCDDEEWFACTWEEIIIEESILTNSGTITPAIIEEIKSDSFIQGSGNSTYFWIEYSDLQCPYCKDLHNSNISREIMDEVLNWNVDYSFKHYPKAFHLEALPAHQILECIAETQWQEAFYTAIDLLFKSDEKLSSDLLQSVLSRFEGEENSLNSCVESGKYREKIFAHIGEAVGIFDAKYVPSTIIINTENGKWISYVGNETKEKIVKELVHLE